MTITTENNELVVRIPLTTKRFNPYDDKYTGEMPNIVGVIEHHNDWDEMGFMYLQDMAYKNKGDQLTDWAVKYHGDKENFDKLCKKLKIDIWYI